jgi:hypothetical protein
MAHSTTHAANRITYRGSADCEQTRARFGERVPLIDQAVAPELAVAGAAWAGAGAEVTARPGPTGLVSLTRVDQGACSASAANTFRKPENGQRWGPAARPEHEQGGTRHPS